MSVRSFHHNTLLRFLFFGGAASVFYATLAALATSHLSLPKPMSAGGAWIICIPLGFWCQRRFTFAANFPRRHGFWLYAATQILGICTVATASHFFAVGVFWPDVVVYLTASAMAAIVSYMINRWVIFPEVGAEVGSERSS